MVKKRVPSILSGLLKNTEESRYARMIYVAMILLLILGTRLFFMQVIQGNYYKEEADGNRIRHLPMQANRGVMYDRNGVIMAGSRSAYSVIMPLDRKGNTLSEETIQKLSALLHIPGADIKKNIPSVSPVPRCLGTWARRGRTTEMPMAILTPRRSSSAAQVWKISTMNTWKASRV